MMSQYGLRRPNLNETKRRRRDDVVYQVGYDSHLIFCELHKFDAKINVIPNRLEKCMTIFLRKKLTLY